MIVKTTDDIRGTKGEVKTPSWSSCRLLHKEDGMGVTLTDAILEPGLDQAWWYRNHLEAVYCLEGEGTLEDLSTGKVYVVKPGTLYALDKHDRHRLKVKSRMRVVCTFVPPLLGGEIHDRDGSYPLGECGRKSRRRLSSLVSDFMAAEKGATKDQAMRAWRKLKELDVPKTYRSWVASQDAARRKNLHP